MHEKPAAQHVAPADSRAALRAAALTAELPAVRRRKSQEPSCAVGRYNSAEAMRECENSTTSESLNVGFWLGTSIGSWNCLATCLESEFVLKISASSTSRVAATARLTWRGVLGHIKLINEADLSFPIILSASGDVMDGTHRVVKAALEGSDAIDAVQFENDPAPDYVGRRPDDLPY